MYGNENRDICIQVFSEIFLTKGNRYDIYLGKKHIIQHRFWFNNEGSATKRRVYWSWLHQKSTTLLKSLLKFSKNIKYK